LTINEKCSREIRKGNQNFEPEPSYENFLLTLIILDEIGHDKIELYWSKLCKEWGSMCIKKTFTFRLHLLRRIMEEPTLPGVI